jgi:hypothetical protein
VEDGASLSLVCLWREMNDRNFEDRERTSEKLDSFFFYTLFFFLINKKFIKKRRRAQP